MSDRIRVGDVEIITLLDLDAPPREPTQFYPDVPPESWDKYKEYLDENGKFRTNFCGFVVITPNENILVDTGYGPGPHAAFDNAKGAYIDNLKKVGLTPNDIHTVINTHLHGDHIGWNINDEDGVAKPRFPNARYIIPQKDWDYFTGPDAAPERAAAVQKHVAPLTNTGRLETVDGQYQVTPEIVTLPSPGHTPGHQCAAITSKGEKGIIVGDLFHNPVQVEQPDWNVGADIDKEKARESRINLMNRFADEGFKVAAPHIVFNQNIGVVIKGESKRYWQAL